MNFSIKKMVRNSGRVREVEQSKTEAAGNQLLSCHAESRAVTNSLNTHGTVSECSVNATAMRTHTERTRAQQNANDRSTPVQRVLHAWPTRNADVTFHALQAAPTQHRTRLVQAPCKPLASPFEGFAEPFPKAFAKRFPNGSRNNVRPPLCNVTETFHARCIHQAMLQASRKTQWVILASRWVSIGFCFWGCA